MDATAAAMLQITIISADDLQNVSKLGRKMQTYALVSADDVSLSSTKYSTCIDRDGGSNPVWNDKLELRLNRGLARARGYAFTIQIYCKTSFGNGKKLVGWAKVPLSDIIDGYGAPDSLHCLCYRLKTGKGKPHGTIDLSLRLLNPAHKFNINSSPHEQFMGHYHENNIYSYAVPNVTYAPPPHQNTAIGVPSSSSSTWMPMGYPASSSTYGKTSYISATPPPPSSFVYPPPPPPPPSSFVYPPPPHQQIYYTYDMLQ